MIHEAAWATRAVNDFRRGLSWWAAGLRAALPPAVIAAFAGDRRVICLHLDAEDRVVADVLPSAEAIDPSTTVVIHEQGLVPSRETALVTEVGRTRPVIVRCPSAFILLRQVTVPIAATEELDGALRHNLAIWTPFTVDDVHVAAVVVSTVGDQAVIELRLAVKEQVQPLLDRAAHAGLRPDYLALGSSVMDLGQTKKRSLYGGKIDAALAGLAVLLLLSIGAAEWRESSSRLELLRSAIAEQMVELSRQKKIEAAIERLDKRARFVFDKRKSQPPVAEVMAALSRFLPVDADVQEFAWSSKDGRLLVSAPASDDLSKHLAASSLLQVKRVDVRRRGRDGQSLYDIALSFRER